MLNDSWILLWNHSKPNNNAICTRWLNSKMTKRTHSTTAYVQPTICNTVTIAADNQQKWIAMFNTFIRSVSDFRNFASEILMTCYNNSIQITFSWEQTILAYLAIYIVLINVYTEVFWLMDWGHTTIHKYAHTVICITIKSIFCYSVHNVTTML